MLILLLLLSLELADKVTMKRDLEIAREIQTWLVPSKAPEVAGADIAFASRPQNSVAGDYYDAFYPTASAEEKGKLLLVIADVAGKSIPAALLMATLQASLRTIAGEGTPLEELVVRLNRYATAHSLDGRRFTTAVLAEYDPATRQLAYVNAGHNPPILRRAGGETEKLEAGGLPLGIDGSATFDTAAMELKPGDALIFYTDGVIEAFNDKRRRVRQRSLDQCYSSAARLGRARVTGVFDEARGCLCRLHAPVRRHHLSRFPLQVIACRNLTSHISPHCRRECRIIAA